jgi:large subunit ribosomal protein L23
MTVKLKSSTKTKEAKEKTKKAKTEKIKEKPVEKLKEKTKRKEFNPWNVLKYPHLAEKSMNMVELENKLIFIVKRDSDKKQIKEAVERGFDVRVEKVTTEITTKGQKKAYIKLSSEFIASDIASRLGMV